MPKAKSGCHVALNAAVTKEAAKSLIRQAKRANVSRPLYLSALIVQAEKAEFAVDVTPPKYVPHAPVPRITTIK